MPVERMDKSDQVNVGTLISKRVCGIKSGE
jgi:hypothetical protein